MSYQSLLVLLDRSPACTPRSILAVQLAEKFGAFVSAYAPTGMTDLPATTVDVLTAAAYNGDEWDVFYSNASTAIDDFAKYCDDARFERFDTEVGRWPYIENLLHRVNCSDLVMLTQARPDTLSDRALRKLTEELLLHSARPVLLLPYTTTDTPKFERVMLAWKNTRESARAAADALPFLQRAKKVYVVSWREHGDSTPTQERADMDLALGRWLQRHGVTAELYAEPETSRITEAMLSRAADLQVGLIVMGAYGHSRIRERVLGGATRGILDSMTVPVLMSH